MVVRVLSGSAIAATCAIAALGLAIEARIGAFSGGQPATAMAAVTSATPALADRTPLRPSAAGQVVKRAHDGMFYVNARVNGRAHRFLVDTGASVVVIARADAQALGLTLDGTPSDRAFRTVGGETRVTMVRLPSLQLAGRTLHSVEAAIVESGVGTSLLGQNALSQLEAMAIAGDELTMR